MANTEPAAVNGSASTSREPTSSFQPPRSRLSEAATLINRGGLGRSASHIPPSQATTTSSEITIALDLYASQYLPKGPKSLAGVALRSFCLGAVLSLSILLSIYLAFAQKTPLWRGPFFLFALSTFHFLEFYTTALANTSDAKVSSFLLMSNGPAYAIAHTTALIECIISHTFFASPILPLPIHYLVLTIGLCLLFLGQSVRAAAMIHAGSNFSHIVAHHKRSSHELVTTGIYSVLRHPSYFGFFWWGVGTQLLCGNIICLIVYVVVLWRFFQRRIEGEEELLIRFFGEEYVKYRDRTVVGIPFIR